MKKKRLLMVVFLLVAMIVPVQQSQAAGIVGVQGGYIRQNLDTITNANTGVLLFDRKTQPVKNILDIHGGFFEFHYDKTFGLGKMMYLGVGYYFQWAGMKNVFLGSVSSGLNHFIASGLDFGFGINAIGFLEVSVRAGIGFAVSIARSTASSGGYSISTLNVGYGLNWRILPGITFKFGKMGVFIEVGYTGNWLRQMVVVANSSGTGPANTYHGMQIGAGVKLYL